MDYSLLVGIHRCSHSEQTNDESSPDVRLAAGSGVFAIKCSTGECHVIYRAAEIST